MSLALTMFSGKDLTNAISVPFFYAITEILLISIYCVVAWKLDWTKAPKNASLCKVVFTSFELKKSSSKYEAFAKEKETDTEADADTATQATDGATTATIGRV